MCVYLQERICEESASFELSSYDLSSCIQETDRLLTKTVEIEQLNKDFRDDNAAGRFLQLTKKVLGAYAICSTFSQTFKELVSQESSNFSHNLC